MEVVDMDKETIRVLGDFNGHIGLIGKHKNDENGRTVLEWMNEPDLHTTHSKPIDSVTSKCGNYLTQSH